jgi:hypothetical protein
MTFNKPLPPTYHAYPTGNSTVPNNYSLRLPYSGKHNTWSQINICAKCEFDVKQILSPTLCNTYPLYIDPARNS